MSYPFDCISDLVFAKPEIHAADIILIPGGSHPQLMEKAAALYKQSLAPYILPSGSTNPKIPEYSSEWEFLKSIGVKLGVPEEKILKEDQARHTFENAEFSWRIIKENKLPVKKAILVCKEIPFKACTINISISISKGYRIFCSSCSR